MNIRELNETSRLAYIAAGLTGKGTKTWVVGTGVRPVGPLANAIGFTPDSLFDPGDHDTYVASIIRLWLPDTAIISVRVENAGRDNSTERVVAGLEAVAQAVKADKSGYFNIINMSLTSPLNKGTPLAARYTAAVAVLKAAGAVVMASAGNSGALDNNLYPGCIYDVWTGAGLTEDGNRASISTSSNEVDFADQCNNVQVLNLTTLGYHSVMTGTSFTIPILTAKRVLIGAVYRGVVRRWPTDDEAYAIAKALAVDIGSAKGRDPDTGWGYIDLKTPSAVKVLIGAVKEDTTVSTTIRRPTLRQGSTGEYIKQAQASLNKHGAVLIVDGNFGPKTKSAVIVFQQTHALTADGVIGPLTWAALDKAPV